MWIQLIISIVLLTNNLISASVVDVISPDYYINSSKKQGIFINFPVISPETERRLDTCFKELFTNSGWFNCVMDLGEDSCNCIVYQLASEDCIKKYINNHEFIQVFDEFTAKACQSENINIILDYDESEDLTILSHPETIAKKLKSLAAKLGFFDSCTEGFNNCYHDMEKEITDCVNNNESYAKFCNCYFSKKLKSSCQKYCYDETNATTKFDFMTQKVCKDDYYQSRIWNGRKVNDTFEEIVTISDILMSNDDNGDDDVRTLDFLFDLLGKE
ncbi:hypothetical protein DASC09_015300 [Saccharomycopsis crataegensis]|uniref:Uncharacterized protein n=1 Tax=Saccharomycopsis crataegensis TaxID=43959 RepID=A0AAV5QIJ1_9ASCO|nr:hypothetical protein DASC09_015300 [Saccharomycopsis crataegensis]